MAKKPTKKTTRKKWKQYDTGPSYFEEVDGASVEGEILNFTEPNKKKKTSGSIQVITGGGAIRVNRCWVLDNAIKDGFLEAGTYCKLTFLERVDIGGGQDVKRWKIESR